MTNSASTVLVTGNTYPVKESLKALGARWDAANKGWRVPAAKAAEAQAIVAGATRSTYSTYSGTGRRPAGPRGGYRASRARWTGCSCGSREDEPRDSDCASCKHDW